MILFFMDMVWILINSNLIFCFPPYWLLSKIYLRKKFSFLKWNKDIFLLLLQKHCSFYVCIETFRSSGLCVSRSWGRDLLSHYLWWRASSAGTGCEWSLFTFQHTFIYLRLYCVWSPSALTSPLQDLLFYSSGLFFHPPHKIPFPECFTR